jgi:hypothetical protein
LFRKANRLFLVHLQGERAHVTRHKVQRDHNQDCYDGHHDALFSFFEKYYQPKVIQNGWRQITLGFEPIF